MYSRAIRIPLCLLLALSIPTQALAQYCADPTVDPCMQAKQQYAGNMYQISLYAPAECDDEIRTAATAWTNAGSNFGLSDFSYYNSDYVTKGEMGFQIAFNTSAEMGIYGSMNAVTFYGDSVGSWPRPSDGMQIPIVNDGDVVVNQDKHAAGTIECSPTVYSDRYDLTRTMAHEFGHTVGLNHNMRTACATYQTGQKVAFSSLCTLEKDAAKAMYGIRQ